MFDRCQEKRSGERGQWTEQRLGRTSQCWVWENSNVFPSLTFKSNVLNNLISFYYHRVAQAYLNQKKLDAEAKQLHQSAIVFSKQTSQWLALIDNFNSALKELGDVENWTRTIENDMRNITTTLEYAYKGITLCSCQVHELLLSITVIQFYDRLNFVLQFLKSPNHYCPRWRSII